MSTETKKIEIKPANWNLEFNYALKIKGSDLEELKDLIPKGYFYFPINPESMRITTPYAVSVTPTAGGIVQEHSGAVFYLISIKGTTGVTPGRSFQTGLATDDNQSRVEMEKRNEKEGYYSTLDMTYSITTGSGYYAYHALYQVLWRYHNMKKEGKDVQLQFVNFKDGQVYNVAVTSFDLNRDKSQPNLYIYNIEMKGWNLASESETPTARQTSGPRATDGEKSLATFQTFGAG